MNETLIHSQNSAVTDTKSQPMMKQQKMFNLGKKNVDSSFENAYRQN